jgi:hypothetical protein
MPYPEQFIAPMRASTDSAVREFRTRLTSTGARPLERHADDRGQFGVRVRGGEARPGVAMALQHARGTDAVATVLLAATSTPPTARASTLRRTRHPRRRLR